MSHKSYSIETTCASSPSPTPRELKALKKETPPGFLLEVTWVTLSLFMVKVAVDGAF